MDPNDIWKDANENDDELRRNENEDGKDLFKVRNANDWVEEASKSKPPNMLFGEFWYEGEVCILFADSNQGKSILAVQIGDSVSRGVPIADFKMEAGPQRVLYFDFELTMKQFENRYSKNYQDHYVWSENMQRAEIDPNAEMPVNGSFEEYLSFSLERRIKLHRAQVVIVDNLTYLRYDSERARDASPLMKQLKGLKDKYGLSILALAHTPKRDKTKPITDNDLQGSKMLMNFCDSSFAIGNSSKDKSLRYVKQVKQRATEQVYGADNVALALIEKPNNFLQFTFKGFGAEWQHLKQEKEQLSEDMKAEILKLHTEGLSQRKIASKVGVSVSTVNRILNNK